MTGIVAQYRLLFVWNCSDIFLPAWFILTRRCLVAAPGTREKVMTLRKSHPIWSNKSLPGNWEKWEYESHHDTPT